MNSIGNLKSPQLRKLFKLFPCSLMQNLRIFAIMESIYFEFTSLN
jgi:hypothetical protein